MRIDQYLTLVMEQCGYPGNIGDSCAETSRYVHLQCLNGLIPSLNLKQFITPLGYIRHPDAPAQDANNQSWRESDFSSDQGLPLLLALQKTRSIKSEDMRDWFRDHGWKTGNGDFVSPSFLAVIKRWQWLLNLCILVQGILFRLPYRWSESENKFEEMKESSADYLNYIHLANYVPKSLRLISAETLKIKVREYYKPEPNSDFIIDLYDKVIDNLFG